MELTEQDIIQGFAIVNELESRIQQISIAIAELQGNLGAAKDPFTYKVYFEDREILGIFKHYSWGETELNEYVFPMSYIWTRNFIELERVRLEEEEAERKRRAEEKLKAEAREKIAKEEAQRISQEQWDQAEYARLKQKYEGK